MRIKTIKDEDFINYKLPSMFIGTISCGGKCCLEAGIPITVCQNDYWRSAKVLDIPDAQIVTRYLNNPFTSAIVFGGLEPFEQFDELLELIKLLRTATDDTIVIYTGYNEDELTSEIETLSDYLDIIVKFGRYKPDRPSKYDPILGVTLASDNQYAMPISKILKRMTGY